MFEDAAIRGFSENDFEGILSVFNYFAGNSFAVYCETPLNIRQIETMMEQVRIGLVLEVGNKIIGFGYISDYRPFPNFKNTGVLTYFIMPEYTGHGLGTRLFDELISRGRKAGITNYLAHISSKNIQSLNFHKKLGFEEAGNLRNVAKKFGEPFDIVWVQKQFNL